MAKETPEQKAEREQKEQETTNLDVATPDAQNSSSEAVSASNVAASNAAAEATAAANARKKPEGPQNPDQTRPGDRAATPSGKTGKAKFDVVDRFLELSGYKSSDVIGHSDERRTVVTSNGGKYEVSVKGKKLRKLSGPETPADLEAAASEEEDE